MSSGRSSRGGRGGKRGPLPRGVQVSKKVSWLLRHGAGSEGLKLGPGGYVNVQDALNTHALKSLQVTFSELREIVATNDKQRFSLISVSAAPSESKSPAPSEANVSSDDTSALAETLVETSLDVDNPANFLIRANQGHSIAVDTEGLLEPITSDSKLPDIVVHGTTYVAWPRILSSGGLKQMGRNHIHFASGLPSGIKPLDEDEDVSALPDTMVNSPVISGMRTTSSILIYIDLPKALEAGIKFWRSENGVILSEGDEKGVIGVDFFKRVEGRNRRVGILLKDGIPLKELPLDLIRDGASQKGPRGGRGKGKPQLNIEKGAEHDEL